MLFGVPSVAIVLMVVAATWDLVCGAGDAGGGDGGKCSPYVYPGDDDVDVKVAVILGMRNNVNGKCGSSYNIRALQQAIAMNWVAHMVNGDNTTSSFIPGVRIGVDVYDDCNTEYLAARQAGDLASQVRDTLGQFASCYTSSAVPIAGVIGTSISHTTTIVADILESTFVPVLGPSATVSELSDKSKYPNFLRVIPSDTEQAKVIIELAKRYSWSYILGISTSDRYGREGMEELMRLANQELICVTWYEIGQYSDSELDEFARQKLVKPLDETSTFLGIVYFGLEDPLIDLLSYIKRNRAKWGEGYFQKMQKIYWIVSDAVQTSAVLEQLISDYSTNMLVVTPFLTNVDSFKKYFIDHLKDAPDWVQGQWKVAISNVVSSFGYNFSKESMASFKIDDSEFSSYIPASVDAFYLIANTLRAFHNDICGNLPGACPDFKTGLINGLLKSYKILDLNYSDIQSSYLPVEFSNLPRYLRNVSGDFEVASQPHYSIQAIIKNNFAVIGSFQDESVTIYSPFENISKNSECAKTCQKCLDIEEISYIYHPGDFILLGFFSIHWQSDVNPFECGQYRSKSNSYIAMEAFISAIDWLRNNTGVKFGYLILDDCYNTLILSRILTKVMSGDLVIQNTYGNVTFSASKVAIAVGAQSTHATMGALAILKDLKIPVISYSATHPDLDSEILYPFFSRTVSSDTLQVMAITDILLELKVSYVGAIVVKNTYGLEFYKLFRSFAESKKICVTEASEVTDSTSAAAFGSFLKTYKNNNIKAIVVVAMAQIASTLLQAAKEETFVFIASEAWGPNPDIIAQDNGRGARGSLVLGAAVSQLNLGLKEHLQLMNPFLRTSTPWLREFWQDQFQCDMPGGFNNVHGGHICSSNVLSYINSSTLNDMASSPLVVHATMATVSAGLAVRSLIQNNKIMPFDPAELTRIIRSVKLPSAAGDISPFLQNGDGNFGFQIYNIQQSTESKDKYVYVNVGSYDRSSGLSLKSPIKFYDGTGHVTDTLVSSCEFRPECQMVCTGSMTSDNGVSVVTNSPGPGGQTSNSSSDTTIIILAIVMAVFIIITALLLVLTVLAILGKIHFKRKSPFIAKGNATYSTMSPRVIFSGTHGNSYTKPHDSSSDDVPPQLPNRNNYNTASYTNKAPSDIVSPTLLSAPEEPLGRERANSLPLFDQPQICLPSKASSSLPLSTGGVHEGHHLSPVKEGMPILLPLVMGQVGQGTAGDNNPYSGLYRNDQHSAIHSPKYPLESIVFQNVTDDNAIYTLASPVVHNHHVFSTVDVSRSYVPVNTSHGIVYIPSEQLLLQPNAYGSFQNQHKPILSIASPQVQNVVYSPVVHNPVVSGNSTLPSNEITNNRLANDYITPTEVIYSTSGRILENSVDAGIQPSPENGTQRLTDNPAISKIRLIAPDEIPFNVGSTKQPPAIHVGQAMTVDNDNYLMPYHHSKIVPTQGAEARFSVQDRWLQNLDALPDHLQQQPTNIRQEPDLQFKNNLQDIDQSAAPVYLHNKEFPQHNILQDQCSGSDGISIEPCHINSVSADHIQSKEKTATWVTEGRARKKQGAEHIHHQRHQSPSRTMLKLHSDISEEQEPEMV